MDRKRQKFQLRRQRYNRQRILAFCLAFCLILSNLNFGSLLTYATEGNRKSFDIGSDVKAVLKDGVLTVKGYGDTRDFSRDTSPFEEYADEIRTLVIEDGITYIGSYLFYGLGELQGELILPESIVGIGDYAFSGDSPDYAAHFTVIRNEFEGGEITGWKRPEPEESNPVLLATPSQAEKTDSEELIGEDGEKGEADKEGTGNTVNPGNKEEAQQEGTGQTEQGETGQENTQREEADRTEQEETGRTQADRTEQEETGRTQADRTEQEETKRTEADRAKQEGTKREETDRAEQGETKRTETDQAEQEETARKDIYPVIARIVNHQVPFVGEGMPEGNSDSSGSESDTNSGSADTGDDSADSNGGGAGNGGDSADTNSGSADTNGGGADSGGSSTDTSGGSADTSGGSTDIGGSDTDASGGSTDIGGSGTDASGDSADTNGGSTDTGNTDHDIEGDNSGSSNGSSDLPGDGSSQGNSGGLSKDDGTENEGNIETGGAAGTPEGKPGDTAPEDNPNQDLPSVSQNGTGGKGSRPKAERENLDDENPDFDIEYISEQKIENPETLFYEGQTGMVICSPENTTFIEAAEYAGYVMADSCITVILDDMEEMELPAREGQVCLPECPEDIKPPWDDNALFTVEFAGWALVPGTGQKEALAPGTYLDTGEDEHLSLYSVWRTIGIYQMGVKAERQGETAVYTLIDKETGETVKSLDGYAFLCQWQYSPQSTDTREDKSVYDENGNLTEGSGNEDDALWEDIAGENSPVYKRSVEAGDISLRFRCAVTPLRMTRSMTAATPDTLYSESVNGVAELETVYVDQINGNDGNSGLKEAPVKTLEAAAEKLKSREDGGTADRNQIILLQDYDYGGRTDFLKDHAVPVTIKGASKGISLLSTVVSADSDFNLYEDITFESLTILNMSHIYGNGHNITIGDNVSCSGLYLYGASKGGTQFTKPGVIEVRSGRITRIVGYIRSKNIFEADNNKAVIIVDGATVDTIVAGSASGEIRNGDVDIYIKGGTVNKLVGGCQGFSDVKAPYSGKTAINISGGTVNTVYGAGSGRDKGIPTYQGSLDINVTDGNVSNIYGSGSAAYVVSNGSGEPTTVNISVSGGTVGNIYAAGTGGDVGVNGGNDLNGTPSSDFGSLTGKANIIIDNKAVITGNIYASGKGFKIAVPGREEYGTENAYLNGDVNITVNGGRVEGNIYGGGEGVNKPGFEKSARVCKDSKVTVEIKGGTVEGYVYGGGKIAEVEGSTNVIISGGTIKGNVYGGGEEGLTDGKATVHMANGTVNGSIYGGALGKVGDQFVYGGSTVNMTGGWVRGNIYGGSELSNDGKDESQDAEAADGLVFVNMTGGTVSGKVFGGGFQGVVNGSTHVHIGLGAIDKCSYYKSHPGEKPVLDAANLSVGGSVYAGGDYGGGDGKLDYDTITVKGISHVYIDGTYYSFGAGDSGGRKMDIAGGVFGSGASCDAGDVRLVTLDHFGTAAPDGGQPDQVTGTVTSIQRADQVRLIKSHVRLAGQSDVANFDQTALYSLNRIGDKGNSANLGQLENSLVLEGGSTLVLDSAASSVANLKSMDIMGSQEVTMGTLGDNPNTVVLATGTVFRISSIYQTEQEKYGAVKGYFYMIAGDTAEAYAFARAKVGDLNSSDGGFVVPGEKDELGYTNIGTSYRYWNVSGDKASATRHVVLTARNSDSPAAGTDGFAVAEGTVELPPVEAADNIRYSIKSITLSDKMTLVDAALDQKTDTWLISDSSVTAEQEKTKIRETPASTFGLLMRQNTGETGQVSKVISNLTADKDGSHSIIGKDNAWEYHVKDQEKSGIPVVEFSLTYSMDGIHISQNLGNVIVVMERYAGNDLVEEITVKVEIVTRASALSEQTVDLYASESGSYTGRMVIPADSSRSLSLAGVEISGNQIALKAVGDKDKLVNYEVAVSLQPVQSQGWNTANLMSEPYDISTYKGTGGTVLLGTTDSRYEAPVDFVLYNNGNFTAKDTDKIILTLSDGEENKVPVTLNIHWKESIVSDIQMASGKQYNGIHGTETVEIFRESSATAAFTLGNQTGTVSASSVWLELQDDGGKRCPLPDKTKLTLISGNRYYLYTITGEEPYGKIPLDSFTEMWENNIKFTENIASKTITVIAAFDNTEGLVPGDYSLRLRNETGADSKGGYFTVNNTTAAVTLDSQGGLAKGEHRINISVSPQQDTRLSDKAAVVLSLEGEEFPKGTVFMYGEKRYYPVDGRVYLILDQGQDNTVVMDTSHTAGLPLDSNRISTQLFAAGVNAGESFITSTVVSYDVKANPVYGLSVKADTEEGRVAEPGTVIGFTVAYSMDHVEQTETIQVEALRKEGGAYIQADGWKVSGNLALDQGIGSEIKGTAAADITVPEDAADGTYRLVFRLGDQKALYNIIIRGGDQGITMF